MDISKYEVVDELLYFVKNESSDLPVSMDELKDLYDFIFESVFDDFEPDNLENLYETLGSIVYA